MLFRLGLALVVETILVKRSNLRRGREEFREEAIQPLDHIELESGAAEKW